MNLLFEPRGWKDCQYFLQTDKKLLKKNNDLIQDILRYAFAGIGKPEPLKYNLKGSWSRRSEQEQRLVYHAKDETVFITQCRFHY